MPRRVILFKFTVTSATRLPPPHRRLPRAGRGRRGRSPGCHAPPGARGASAHAMPQPALQQQQQQQQRRHSRRGAPGAAAVGSQARQAEAPLWAAPQDGRGEAAAAAAGACRRPTAQSRRRPQRQRRTEARAPGALWRARRRGAAAHAAGQRRRGRRRKRDGPRPPRLQRPPQRGPSAGPPPAAPAAPLPRGPTRAPSRQASGRRQRAIAQPEQAEHSRSQSPRHGAATAAPAQSTCQRPRVWPCHPPTLQVAAAAGHASAGVRETPLLQWKRQSQQPSPEAGRPPRGLPARGSKWLRSVSARTEEARAPPPPLLLLH